METVRKQIEYINAQITMQAQTTGQTFNKYSRSGSLTIFNLYRRRRFSPPSSLRGYGQFLR